MAPERRRRTPGEDSDRGFSPYTRPKSQHRESPFFRQWKIWTERINYALSNFWRRAWKWGLRLDRRVASRRLRTELSRSLGERESRQGSSHRRRRSGHHRDHHSDGSRRRRRSGSRPRSDRVPPPSNALPAPPESLEPLAPGTLRPEPPAAIPDSGLPAATVEPTITPTTSQPPVSGSTDARVGLGPAPAPPTAPPSVVEPPSFAGSRPKEPQSPVPPRDRPTTGSSAAEEKPAEPVDDDEATGSQGERPRRRRRRRERESSDSSGEPSRRRRRKRRPASTDRSGERIESTADLIGAVRPKKKDRRALYWSLAGCLLLAGLWWGGRSWYLARQARAASELRRQIAERVTAADWRQAAALGEQYLRLRPHDHAAQLDRARHFGLAATTDDERRQAAEVYTQTLTAVGENVELRGRLASTLWELGRVVEADQQAQRLLQKEPYAPLGWRIRALVALRQAEQGRGDFPTAIDLATQALNYDTANIELAEALAKAYRERLPQLTPEERGRQMEEIWSRLLTANPHLPRAWLARYRDRLARSHPDADADLDQALRLAPQDDAILVAAGQRALVRQRLDQAEEYFSRAVELAPQSGWATLGRGDVERDRGRLAAALEWWQRVPTSEGDDLAWEALTRRCAAARDARQTEEAGKLLDELRVLMVRNEGRLSPQELESRRALLSQWDDGSAAEAAP